ncbi:hypothetical protein ACVBGC_30230 [Burkholderia stagnalis]
MRMISAALFAVAAALPPLAHATSSYPDPADAAAPVPDVAATSVFDGFQPYRDHDGPGWKQLNRDVAARPAKARAASGAMPGMTAGDGHAMPGAGRAMHDDGHAMPGAGHAMPDEAAR